MPKRSRAASPAAQVYASRIARLAPFTSRRFPPYSKATTSDKRSALAAYKTIFGWTPRTDRAGRPIGEEYRPLIGKHTTVVRFVSGKQERQRAERAARAYQAELEADYRERLQNWEADRARGVGRAKPERPSVRFDFKTVLTKEQQRIKADIGQETPAQVRAAFLRQEPVPGEPEQWMSGDVIQLPDQWITVNGYHLIHFRPVDARRYVMDPQSEEARVMALLRRDFDAIAAYWLKKHRVKLSPNRINFAPQTGMHRYYDVLPWEEKVHNLLAYWRNAYGTDVAKRAGRGSVASWLTGINMIVYLDARRGANQLDAQTKAQMKRRIKARKVGRQIQAFRSKKAKPLPRRRRR